MRNFKDDVKINKHKLEEECDCFHKVQQLKLSKKLIYWLLFFFIFLIVVSFLPWTQNINAKGKVTTLRPEDRPQSVYPIIPGRIEQWYVREGDSVKAGDTLARLSEIKSDYQKKLCAGW